MKKNVLFACVLLMAATTLAAHAQDQINFADLPLIASPAPLPAGYAGLNWANMFYVDPGLDASLGIGFVNHLTHRDAAFVGGEFCAPMQSGCFGIISSPGGPTAFVPVSAVMSAGHHANVITLSAYRNGKYIGETKVTLAVGPTLVVFPSSWGVITELQIETDEPGDAVLLDLSVFYVAG